MRYKRTLLQVLLGVVIGAGQLLAGTVIHRVYLEAAGVMVVLLSVVWAVVSRRRHVAGVRPARSGAESRTATGTKRRAGQTRRAWMMERMDERWRRRQEGNGGMSGQTRR